MSNQVQYSRYQDLIGRTPLVDLTHLLDAKKCKLTPGTVKVLAKVEYFNPSFSIKDRIVREIFDDAEERGVLRPGGTVVAASSGNTAAAVAMLAAMRGYKAVITTSPKCSSEKMASIRAYGATLIVTPSGLSSSHPDHYMNMANRMAKQNAGWFNVNQYDSLKNPLAHFKTLGPEIWEQTQGTVTHFICGGSTGGTITGVGRYLKQMNQDVKVILADPVNSIFGHYHATGEVIKPTGKYLVEGVGKGNIPGAIDFKVIDGVVKTTDNEAFKMCRHLARTEGILAGGSSGLNVCSAMKYAEQCTTPSTIVTVLCDTGIKYLSKVYNNSWLTKNNLDPAPEPEPEPEQKQKRHQEKQS